MSKAELLAKLDSIEEKITEGAEELIDATKAEVHRLLTAAETLLTRPKDDPVDALAEIAGDTNEAQPATTAPDKMSASAATDAAPSPAAAAPATMTGTFRAPS